MNQQTERIIGAAGGVGFVVLTIIGTFIYQQPPSVESDPATIIGWVGDYRTGLKIGMVCAAIGAVMLVMFAARLRQVLADAGSRLLASVVYGAGIGCSAVIAVDAIPVATLVFIEGQPGGFLGDGAIARLLLALNQTLFGPSVGFMVLMLAATGFAVLETRIFSTALGWAAILISIPAAALAIISQVAGTYPGTFWFAVSFIAYVGFMLVVLWISVVIYRGAEGRAEAKTPVLQ